jgi:hypothetical protein
LLVRAARILRGDSRAIAAIRRAIVSDTLSYRWLRVCIWISDRAGWTKLYHIPTTDELLEHWQRHGRKCSGSPNCDNWNCISDSLPKWFKRLTVWHDEEGA